MSPKSYLHIDPQYGWTQEKYGGLQLFYIGRQASVHELVRQLSFDRFPDLEELWAPLAALPGHFAALVKGSTWALAVADKVAGYPAYYFHRDEDFQASNSARLLQSHWGLAAGNARSLLELRTAGYVTGPDTLFRHLYKLQAGEAVLWDEKSCRLLRKRYYLFYSPEVRNEPEDDLIDELEALTNAVIDRHLEEAGDRQVVVPLSGGLDSRVLLAKLKKRGCRNLWAFSYGASGNYEAKVASEVSEAVHVPWIFVPTDRSEARAYFWSDERKRYWEYADGLHIVPNLHAMFALRSLREKGRFSGGAVLINGQSGDFITGDHIPAVGSVSNGVLHANLIAKHYALRRRLLDDDAVLATVRSRIDAVLGEESSPSSIQDYAKIHELWEWQGRQAIRVVHGQRNYDYYELGWELPLWEREYLEFWSRIPLEHKMGRRLFRRWLEREDFYGLFRDYRPFISRWPGNLVWVQHGGRALRALFGAGLSKRYYGLLDYFSQYSYLYGPISYPDYLKHCWDYKGPLPYYVDVWEGENMGLFPDGFA